MKSHAKVVIVGGGNAGISVAARLSNATRDLDIAVITHDFDSRQESAAILSAVNGAMSEQYRREIGRRTRRGLEGLALNRKSTGGRAFGYVAASDTESGEREINPEQAEIVAMSRRDIFSSCARARSWRSLSTRSKSMPENARALTLKPKSSNPSH